eukprot:GHVS01058772.1.p1 GENE.GHVS01058772.1~~GHVS01058772.1.p1  ORF type:complete len:365 (+),score=32.33 GHVS01058772.1:273-1367(+)
MLFLAIMSKLKMKFHLSIQLCLILPSLLLTSAASIDYWNRLGTGAIYIIDKSSSEQMDFKTIVTISSSIPEKVPGSNQGFAVVGGSSNNHIVRRDGKFIVHLNEPLNLAEKEFLKTSSLGVRFLIKGEEHVETLKHLLPGLVNADVAFTYDSCLTPVLKSNNAVLEIINSTFGNGVIVSNDEWEKLRRKEWTFSYSNNIQIPLDRDLVEWTNIGGGLGGNVYGMVLTDTYEHGTVCVTLKYTPLTRSHLAKVKIRDTTLQSSEATVDVKDVMWGRLAKSVGMSMLLTPDPNRKGNESEEITLAPDVSSLPTLDFIAAIMLALPDKKFNMTRDVADAMRKNDDRPLIKQFLETVREDICWWCQRG